MNSKKEGGINPQTNITQADMLSTATIKHKNLCLCTWWERMQCFREADSELRGVGRAGSMGVSGGSPQQCLHSRLATLRGRRHYESLSTGNVNTKQKHCFYHLTHRGFCTSEQWPPPISSYLRSELGSPQPRSWSLSAALSGAQHSSGWKTCLMSNGVP